MIRGEFSYNKTIDIAFLRSPMFRRLPENTSIWKVGIGEEQMEIPAG